MIEKKQFVKDARQYRDLRKTIYETLHEGYKKYPSKIYEIVKKNFIDKGEKQLIGFEYENRYPGTYQKTLNELLSKYIEFPQKIDVFKHKNGFGISIEYYHSNLNLLDTVPDEQQKELLNGIEPFLESYAKDLGAIKITASMYPAEIELDFSKNETKKN